MTQFISYLGTEIKENDIVKFSTSNMNLFGKVSGFENEKVIVETKGCQYKTEEELEYIKSKAKKSYKVNPKRCIIYVKKQYV